MKYYSDINSRMHRFIKAEWGWKSSAKEKERIWFCRIERKLWGKDEVFHEVEVSLLFSQLSFVWLFVTLWTIAQQAPLSMGFSRQKYWSGLPFPSPGNLPDSGIKHASPPLTGGFFTTEPPGKPRGILRWSANLHRAEGSRKLIHTQSLALWGRLSSFLHFLVLFIQKIWTLLPTQVYLEQDCFACTWAVGTWSMLSSAVSFWSTLFISFSPTWSVLEIAWLLEPLALYYGSSFEDLNSFPWTPATGQYPSCEIAASSLVQVGRQLCRFTLRGIMLTTQCSGHFFSWEWLFRKWIDSLRLSTCRSPLLFYSFSPVSEYQQGCIHWENLYVFYN